MTVPADDELERLRRVAYSRTGTPDDLRRLAELEHPPVDALAGAAEEPHDVAHEKLGAVRRRRRGIVVTAAVAAVIGAVAGSIVTGVLLPREPGVQPEAETPPSLALEVFDRVPTPDDDPSNLDHWMGNTAFEEVEIRLLQDHGETQFYALRGTRWSLEEVCLVVESPSASAMACAAVEQFLLRGITMRTGDIVARWDPASHEVWFGAPS